MWVTRVVYGRSTHSSLFSLKMPLSCRLKGRSGKPECAFVLSPCVKGKHNLSITFLCETTELESRAVTTEMAMEPYITVTLSGCGSRGNICVSARGISTWMVRLPMALPKQLVLTPRLLTINEHFNRDIIRWGRLKENQLSIIWNNEYLFHDSCWGAQEGRNTEFINLTVVLNSEGVFLLMDYNAGSQRV